MFCAIYEICQNGAFQGCMGSGRLDAMWGGEVETQDW